MNTALLGYVPWRCPACQSIIRHGDGESTPSIGVRYRCHICRLELEFDRDRNRLAVAPIIEVDRSGSAPESWGARNVTTPPPSARRKNPRRPR